MAGAVLFHELEQLGGQRREVSARSWWVSWLELRRLRSGEGPTHTQNLESRSHRPRAGCVCVFGCGVGVPHPMGGGGRWFLLFCARAAGVPKERVWEHLYIRIYEKGGCKNGGF